MMLGYTYTPSDKQELKNDIFIKSIIVTIIPLLLLLILNPFHKTMALSPSFELQEMINENHHWVLTYGNSDAHLKSNYTDILSVDYISNGKTLNSTFWLASAFKNSSAAIYNHHLEKSLMECLLMLIPIQGQDIMGLIMIFMWNQWQAN